MVPKRMGAQRLAQQGQGAFGLSKSPLRLDRRAPRGDLAILKEAAVGLRRFDKKVLRCRT